MSPFVFASKAGQDKPAVPEDVNRNNAARITITAEPHETAEAAALRRMWQSVVLQAFYDALLDERPPGRRHKWSTVAATSTSNVPTVKDRARFWLLEAGKDFADVCGFADLDPEAVREAARRMLRDETSVRKARSIFASARTPAASEGAGAAVRDLPGAGELRGVGDVPQG